MIQKEFHVKQLIRQLRPETYFVRLFLYCSFVSPVSLFSPEKKIERGKIRDLHHTRSDWLTRLMHHVRNYRRLTGSESTADAKCSKSIEMNVIIFLDRVLHTVLHLLQ